MALFKLKFLSLLFNQTCRSLVLRHPFTHGFNIHPISRIPCEAQLLSQEYAYSRTEIQFYKQVGSGHSPPCCVVRRCVYPGKSVGLDISVGSLCSYGGFSHHSNRPSSFVSSSGFERCCTCTVSSPSSALAGRIEGKGTTQARRRLPSRGLISKVAP